MSALHDGLLGLVNKLLAKLLLVEALNLPFPLFLDDLDHVTLIFWLENW